jgi:flagella basal body P-ring formation protein FlgA
MAALALLAVAAAARPSGATFALLREAEVHGDSIYLSDLLGINVPAGARRAANKILLGTAPQPGTTRVFTRADITSRIDEDADLRTLEIPDQIVVRRAGRLITREEVLATIRAALEHNGFSDAAVLAPDDVRLAAPVMVSAGDADLHVTRMDFDPALKQMRFLLVSRAAHGALPFLATARLRGQVPVIVAAHEIQPGQMLAPGDFLTESRPADAALHISPQHSEELIGQRALVRVAPGEPLRPAQYGAVPAVTLVAAGKPATLRLVSGTMQMLLEVIPLERGIHGQNIRVRLKGTGKVLHAQVIGAGHLEASF